jgi:hypothetical protein
MATYNIHLNMIKVQEWKISLSQATLFDLYSKSTSWATEIIHEGLTYYWCARTKVIQEIPVLTNKPDTVYRLTKELAAAGLIMYEKIQGKDCIRLTEKGKSWNSEKNPSKAQNSENYPNDLGKKSENNSEKNPTYNTTSKDNSTRDKEKKGAQSIFTPLDYKREWEIPFMPEFKSKLEKTDAGKKALAEIAELWETWLMVRYKAHNRKFNSDISEAQALKTFLGKCKGSTHAIESLQKMIAGEHLNPFTVDIEKAKKESETITHFGIAANRLG